MKKSKHIELVLITAALASCNRPEKEWGTSDKKVYMRSDTTAGYSRAHTGYYGGHGGLWYYAFRPYGNYNGAGYRRYGYYSDALSHSSNAGTNAFKGSVLRGGFGHGGFYAGS